MKAKIFFIAWICLVAQGLKAQESNPPGGPHIAWMETAYNAPANYGIVWNMWWGENGSLVKLEENGQIIDRQAVIDNTPEAQAGAFALLDREAGVHTYVVYLCDGNAAAEVCTASDSVTITVSGGDGSGDSGAPQPDPGAVAPVLDAELERIVLTARPLPGIPTVDLANPANNPENVQRVMRVLSQEQWDHFFPIADPVYTYEEFLKAVGKFPYLCGELNQTDAVCALELATIFAHATQETGAHAGDGDPLQLGDGSFIEEWRQGMFHIREMGCELGGCDYRGGTCEPDTWQGQTWPCAEGAQYYGRGGKQLSYNYNYGPFSDVMFGDVNVLLQDPDRVAREGWLAVSSAVWFYMTPQSPKPSMHDVVVGHWVPNEVDLSAGIKSGFGATINIINGGVECGGSTEIAQAQNRIKSLAL